jgi:predicted DNA-binding transcriptional regulator YafY
MNNFLDFQSFHVINEDAKDIMEKLKDAISNKFVVQLYYHGETKGVVEDGYRKVEPLAIGNNKHGNTVLRAWLIEGTSKTGKIDPSLVPGYRLFRLDRITIVDSTLQVFKERPGYNPDDQGMTEIIISAKF